MGLSTVIVASPFFVSSIKFLVFLAAGAVGTSRVWGKRLLPLSGTDSRIGVARYLENDQSKREVGYLPLLAIECSNRQDEIGIWQRTMVPPEAGDVISSSPPINSHR